MNKESAKASPIITWLGGVCCIPIAFLRNDRTITILVKLVIIISSDGAKASNTNKNKSCNSLIAPSLASLSISTLTDAAFAVTTKIIVKTVMATVNAISRPHNRFICLERGDFFFSESTGLFFI